MAIIKNGAIASFSNTPQANGDLYCWTEDQLLALGSFNQLHNVVSLDVLANDLGGAAKTLYSVDDGINALTDLLQSDVAGGAWEGVISAVGGGDLIRIHDGKIELDFSSSVAALTGGTTDIQALAVGDEIQDTFVYAIKLANGTLSWAGVTVDIHGSNDIAAISGAGTGNVTEDMPGQTSTGGILTVTDVDHGENHFQVPVSLAGLYGNFAFDATSGQWGYTLDHDLADGLQAGEIAHDLLTVTSADGTASKTIDVTITGTGEDSNHPPSDIALSNASIAENSANGTVVGMLSAADPDSGDTFTYSLLDNAGGLFAIDHSNLVVAGAIDYEAATSHQVTVLVTDAGGASYQETFTIQVTDVAGQIITGTPNPDALSGTPEDDQIFGLGGNDRLGGGGGNDLLDGGPGNDTATYLLSATGGLTVNLAAGVAFGAGVGTDTLHSIEGINGSNFADSYNAVGFGASILNANIGSSGTFNQFQGNGGNDSIAGNGNTRLLFTNASAGVIVDLAAGTADGDGSVGHDTLSGVNGVTGSNFNDQLLGSAGADIFDGRAGDDYIDGRGNRLDQVRYGDDPNVSSGIVVHLAAGTVTGDVNVGTDTLRSIETVAVTKFNDVYDATGFSGSSINAGDDGTWNQYLGGQGGNDHIIGNDNTQINYSQTVIGAVTIDIAAGTADYGTGPTASHDVFTGVHAVVGSNFNDFLYGSDNGLFGPEDLFQPGAGNDFIDGRGGHDEVMYGTGASSNVTSGIAVHLAAGTLTGDPSIGNDTLRSIEAISGTNFDDLYDASGFGTTGPNIGSQGANNYFTPNGGNDTIIGNGSTTLIYNDAITVDWGAGTVTGGIFVGTDHFSGVSAIVSGGFNDTFIGDNANNQVMAGAGNDSLSGNGGDDFLSGDLGNDLLNGGAGTDDLLGGPGNDTFIFAPGSEVDRIGDFTAGAGTDDRIDLTAFASAGFHTLSDVTAVATDDGVTTTIDFGGGDMVVLTGVVVGQLHEDDFVFG
jgi:VCBS repeat-containing protein